MASTVPAESLPRSNHHSTITAHSERIPLIHPKEPPHSDVPDLGASNPSFTHPEHTIPPRAVSGLDTLVIVCCHAIFHPDANDPGFPLFSPHLESNWLLAPFQKSNPQTGKPGEHETFLAHISAGLDAITTSPTSTLVFSGGVTKQSHTSLSEARSYYHAALGLAVSSGQDGGTCLPKTLFDAGRILLEEHATDSFQNLLFSVLLFRRTTGHYPKHIQVITHAFKARRFLELHGPAIRWPSERIRVQGINPVMSKAEYEDTLSGEERFGLKPWLEDPFGIGEVLDGKRRARGWDKSTNDRIGDELQEAVKRVLAGVDIGEEKLPWCMDCEERERTGD